jgi:DNA helicase-2/ATP-dependent DNA helicase PcrA
MSAVTAPVGVVVVRAGAGSGKTTVLTRRIAWRVASGTASPDHTLAITFTRQAATEMRTRLRRFGIDGQPSVHTFHALGLRLLTQRASDTGRQKPLVATDRNALLRTAVGKDVKQASLPRLASAIDHATVRLMTQRAIEDALAASGLHREMTSDEFRSAVQKYDALKRRRGVVDTNDLISHVVRDAREDRRFLASIRHQFRHVSVDEAQDMNPLQYEFLRLLLDDPADLFVVGDPNQAIYGFNGADSSLFDELPGLGTGAHVVTLPSNYRCTPQVVEAATRLLRNAGQQVEAVSCRPNGGPVAFAACDDEMDELRTVATELTRMQRTCGTWNQLAVLVRVNALADTVRTFLEACGIPVRSGRRGPDWSAAVAQATSLSSRDALSIWSSDVLDSGDYAPGSAEHDLAGYVRRFLDENRGGSVDGRAFGSWLLTSADQQDVSGVEVMTFHAAKGREWWGVVVAAAETGYLPHSSARTVPQKAEEARLGYVALTRAATDLVVTWAATRRGRSRTRSSWLPVEAERRLSQQGPPPAIRERAREAEQRDPLADALREWREAVARRSGLSANGILTDRHIKEIVRTRPATVRELADVIDMAFATRHGESILAVVSSAGRA